MKLSKPQLNHDSTQPQPNITLVGLDTKLTFTPPPPPTHTRSWEHLGQILTVWVTLVQATFV